MVFFLLKNVKVVGAMDCHVASGQGVALGRSSASIFKSGKTTKEGGWKVEIGRKRKGYMAHRS